MANIGVVTCMTHLPGDRALVGWWDVIPVFHPGGYLQGRWQVAHHCNVTLVQGVNGCQLGLQLCTRGGVV